MQSERDRLFQKNLLNRDWRLSHLYYIQPKSGPRILFKPNWAQRLLLKSMWFMMLILKGRQFGITTFFAILYLDMCLFNSDTTAGVIAHDQKSQYEIFDKIIRFAWDNLPTELHNQLKGRHESGSKISFANGSSIQVTLGRSSTVQFLHVSEFGKICAQSPSKAREIVTGAFEAVGAGQYITVESTAEGQSGYFYDFVQEAIRRQESGQTELLETQFKFFFLEWWRHPEYTIERWEMVLITKEMQEHFKTLEDNHGIFLTDGQKAWYSEKWRRHGEDVFREYPSTQEEAFLQSVQGSYLKRQMSFLRKKGQITIVPHQPGVPVNTGWDLGVGDEMVIVYHQQVAMQHRIIGVFHDSGEGLDYYVKEMQSNGWVWGEHYIPHDGGHDRLGVEVETVQSMLNGLGLSNVTVVPRIREKSVAIEITRKFLPTVWIDHKECEWLIDCLDNFQKEWDEQNGCFRKKPLHNWAMHGYDAVESLARGLAGTTTQSGKKHKRRHISPMSR